MIERHSVGPGLQTGEYRRDRLRFDCDLGASEPLASWESLWLIEQTEMHLPMGTAQARDIDLEIRRLADERAAQCQEREEQSAALHHGWTPSAAMLRDTCTTSLQGSKRCFCLIAI
jgi:hypothetical protein